MQSVSLLYNDLKVGGTSDKEYRLRIERSGNKYVVNYENGPRGHMQGGGTKTPEPVDLETANEVFTSVMNRKIKDGYQPSDGPTVAPVRAAVSKTIRTPYPIENLEEISEEADEQKYLLSGNYLLQDKSNGEFCQIQKLPSGGFIRFNKLGGLVDGIPGEIVADLKSVKADTFFMCGEIIGNRFVGENLLEVNGRKLVSKGYGIRYELLCSLIPAKSRHLTVVATWAGHDKLVGRGALEKSRAEGVVYKLISAPYRSKNSGQHKKLKFTKTLSAVVIGLRHKGHNSATVGVLEFEGGKEYTDIGKCSLIGKPAVEIGTVIEVRYLYATAGKRLYQPRMERIRTDVLPQQCTLGQLIYKQGVSA